MTLFTYHFILFIYLRVLNLVLNFLAIVTTHLVNTHILTLKNWNFVNSSFEKWYHGITYSLGSCDILPSWNRGIVSTHKKIAAKYRVFFREEAMR
jgi:hypothetical protein